MKMRGSVSSDSRKTLVELARGNEDVVDNIVKYANVNTNEVEIFFDPFDLFITGYIIYNGKGKY